MKWESIEVEPNKFHYIMCLSDDEWFTLLNGLLHAMGTLTDEDNNIIVDIPELPNRKQELQKWYDDMGKIYDAMEGPPERLDD